MPRYAIYKDTKVELQEGVTVDAVKSALSAIYPEIRSANSTVAPNGDIIFTVATATKGI
jgi:hypothetical protein